MGSGNVETVRRIYAEWERGDWSSNWWADPGIVLELGVGFSRTTFAGLRQMAAGWRDFLSTWEGLAIRLDELRELDDERVLALVHNTGKGKLSGADILMSEGASANLFEFRAGKVVRLVAFTDRRHALRELGLEAE